MFDGVLGCWFYVVLLKFIDDSPGSKGMLKVFYWVSGGKDAKMFHNVVFSNLNLVSCDGCLYIQTFFSGIYEF